MKQKSSKSLRTTIIALYLMMSILNITLLTLVISDNQVEIITENANFKARDMLMNVAKKMKEYTAGITAKNTTNTHQEPETLQLIDSMLKPIVKNYLISDEAGNIIHQSMTDMGIPDEFSNNVRKSVVNREYSGSEYLLYVDKLAENIHYFFPLSHIGLTNRVLYTSYDLKSVRGKYDKLFNSILIIVVMVVIFHLFMAIYIYRLIIGPIFQLGNGTREIASGKYQVRIHLKRKDELGDLANGFNYMAEQIAIIETQKQEEAKYNENRKYLDNINEGLMLIAPDFTVSGQYSRFMKKLFPGVEISGKNLMDLIHSGLKECGVETSELENYLHVLFTNKTASEEMLADASPLQNKFIVLTDPTGESEKKTVKIAFQRVFNNGSIENIMVLFEDKTNIIEKEMELEMERIRKDGEMEAVSAILKQGPQVFQEFIREVGKVLGRGKSGENLLANPGAVSRLNRDLGVLKGMAENMDLKRLAENMSVCQEILARITTGSDADTRGMAEEFQSSERSIREYLSNLESALDRIVAFRRFGRNAACPDADDLLNDFAVYLQDRVGQLSQELEKDVELKLEIRIKEFPYLNRLRGCILALIANAIDHGIEDKFERLSKSKSVKGVVTLKLSKTGQEYSVIVADDGAGIDFDAVKKRSLDRNLLPSGSAEVGHLTLIKLVFSPGFGKEEKSPPQRSLYTIRKEIQEMQGNIHVSTIRGKGTEFLLRLPELHKPEELL